MRIARLQQIFAFFVLFAATAWGQARPIDTAASKLIVHAFKTGLFSGFADNHEIEAPIAEGSIDEAAPRVNFVVESRNMKVLDPQISAERRRVIQGRMVGPEVLDVERFPKIAFESTKVERSGEGQFVVEGRLSLHGVTRAITIKVRSESGRYLGSCALKQRDFGIEPISIVGGTVKVKDELKIDFDIRTAIQVSNIFSSRDRLASRF
jgi:YceI-like protein